MEGGGGEARSVVFYEGLRLWEAHLYVFYEAGRLSGLTEWWDRVCPLKKDPHGRGGEGEGGEARSVLFYEGLRLWEARFVVFYEGLRLWGGRSLTKLKTQVGPLKNMKGRGTGGKG